MSVNVQVWMASKEVADRLEVHVRTLRNWLEMFVPENERQKNPQGHYLISEVGFELLKEVKTRKDAGNGSHRDIQRQMVEEGILSEEILTQSEELVTSDLSLAFQAGQAHLHDVELTIQETLFHFQQELGQLTSVQQMQSAILQKIADIEEKQESLRLEMRRVTFEMDLMQQRLTRRKLRHDRHEHRWSLNPFRWFTRSSQRFQAE